MRFLEGFALNFLIQFVTIEKDYVFKGFARFFLALDNVYLQDWVECSGADNPHGNSSVEPYNMDNVDEDNTHDITHEDFINQQHEDLAIQIMDPPPNTSKQQQEQKILQLRSLVDSNKEILGKEALERIKQRDDEFIKTGREFLYEQLKEEGKSVKDFWETSSNKPESKRTRENSSLVEDFADPNLEMTDFIDPDA